ncbi:MAG: tartrate dehydrogenase [Alicyclobacillus macrosporangiidus]|uniref:tartrate dehydrogenase n=1 Tax=Alicyclobacillus macrosporangiidus TaxID=392015 RepID=UPI0026F1E3A7|nr:tartrate dehydrogenase [Alicyclobacillus macrosporangiidus]MCL6599106.1 tartrate dehydrogenase [Alicyclobacillus macrosporangiidus]
MNRYRVALIPGDGIGKEVVPAAVRVLNAAAELHGGLRFDYQEFPWSCEYYLQHGEMMPKDALQILSDFELIFLGACGYPSVPDHVSLWGMLIPIRRGFQQYINLRPVKTLRGVPSPLKSDKAGEIDFVVVRENSEGEYSSMGGRIHEGTPFETAVQVSYFSRMAVERVLRYAFDLAAKSPRKRLMAATKSNGIIHTMPFWDQVHREISKEYPDVSTRVMHVDALAAYFVLQPHELDVVVASNLFGDILTDLGAAIMGSIGMAPAANINPERKYPSMFEPVHGSAPDIAGRGIANPIGQIWTAKMMLDFIGEQELGAKLLDAIEATLVSGRVTPDLGGRASTDEVADAVIDHLLGRGRA